MVGNLGFDRYRINTLWKSGLLVMTVVCFAKTSAAWAAVEENHKNKRDGVVLREVVVKGQQESSPLYKNFPSTVNIVSQEDIQKKKPTDVTDVLRNVPGVNYNDEDGRGFRPNIALRGLDPTRSRNVLILQDGFPVQPSAYGDPAAYYNVPVETLDHIEVIKGGSTLLYGANSLGGVINYVTKKPSEKPYEVTNKETFGEDSLFVSETSVSGTLNRLGYRASYLRKQGEGFRESDGFHVHNPDLYLNYKIDDHSEIISRSSWYHENSQTPGGLTRAQYDADPLQSQYSDDDFEGRRANTNLTYRNQFADNQSLETYFNYNFFSRDWYIARATPTNQQFKRDFNVFGFGGKYQLNYDLLGMEGNSLTFGNDYYFDKEKDIQDNGATRNAESGIRVADNDLTTFAFDFYAVTDLHPTSRLTISPILRMDSVRSGLRNNVTSREGHDSTVAWLPGIGADYLLSEKSETHFYGSFHKSFQAAEFKEALDPTSGSSNNLDAQAGYHYELGLKSLPSKWLSLNTAVFLFDFDNETITEGSARTNGQATRHAGWENAMTLNLTEAARKLVGFDIPEKAGDLSTGFNFTLIDTDFRKGPNNGNELPYAPNWHYNWSLNYKHPAGVYANLSAEWVDEQFSTGNNSRIENAAGSTGIIPSYKVWDLNFGYDFNERWGIFMGIKNLFDEKYFTRRDTFFTGIVPSPDRQIYFGTKIKLG